MAENGGNGGKEPKVIKKVLSAEESERWEEREDELMLEGMLTDQEDRKRIEENGGVGVTKSGERYAKFKYGEEHSEVNPAQRALEWNEVRKIKKSINKSVKKTLKRPYLKNGIIQRKAENEEKIPGHQTLRHNMDKYRKNLSRIQTLGTANSTIKTLRGAEKLQDRIAKEDEKLTENAKPIKFQLMLIDLKRAFSGPLGWALSCKNCFSKFCIMVCFVGSSVALTLLSATGVL